MAKKLKTALRDLTDALDKHADVVGDDKASAKKLEKATRRVREAAIAYAAIAYHRSGAASPFADIKSPGLGEDVIASLRSEKELLAARNAAKKASGK